MVDRYIVETGAFDSSIEDNGEPPISSTPPFGETNQLVRNVLSKHHILRQSNSVLPPKHIVAAYRLSEAR